MALTDKLRPGARVYGPYTRKDGRKHVVLWWSKGRTQTISYPKWLMEQRLGRELDPDLETVDHKDRDFTNDNDSNFQLLPRSDHSKIDAIRAVPLDMTCVWCGTLITIQRAEYNHRRKIGKAGPFCSRVCSGRYGAVVRNGGSRLLISAQVDLEYTKLDKPG